MSLEERVASFPPLHTLLPRLDHRYHRIHLLGEEYLGVDKVEDPKDRDVISHRVEPRSKSVGKGVEEAEDLLSLLSLLLPYLIVQQHHLLWLHEERLAGRRLLVDDTSDVALIAGVDRKEETAIAHHGGGISIDPALLPGMTEDPLHRSPKRTLERADRSADTP